MALDAIKIYIHNVKEKQQQVFYNGLCGWSFRENRQDQYQLSYVYNADGVYVTYKPHSHKGTLSIKFNVAKLITGDNISSVFCFDIHELQEKLKTKLDNIINFNELKHIVFWKVSYFENNINIIRDIHEINALYKFIYNNRHNFLPRFNCEAKHVDGGRTIVFFNAKNKSDATIVIKFYYKLRQIENTSNEFDIQKYYEDNDLINIRIGQDVLRMEITMHRDKIREQFKPQIKYSSLSIDINEEQAIKTIQQQIGTFEDIIDYRHQILMLNTFINKFHLNKCIITRDKLFEFINHNHNFKNKEQRTTARIVVNILNLKDKYHKKKPPPTTINRYKNFILDSGYHYLYSESEIQPIIVENIIENLPDIQQEAIKNYKDSNIYYDVWYYGK